MDFLEIRNMSKQYNKQKVLDKVNLSLPSKGLFCLIGESGGGKSTFLNCLSGIEKMDKGEVYFQNKKIKNFERFRNKYIAIIYQNINLLSFLNIKDNITLKGECDKDKITHLKIDKFINTKRNVLSGGEAQRVAIARAITSNAKILLCDEPTGSLDKENAELVMVLLKELAKEILVIMVTHNKALVNKYADYVMRLENNTIDSPYIKEENIKVFSEKLKFLSIKHILKIGLSTILKNKMKMIISILSLSISFSFLLLSFNASNNIKGIIDDNRDNYLDYNMLRIIKEKSNKIENTSLTLVKEERLDLNDIKELNYLIDLSMYNYDLSPIFSYYPSINCPVNSETFFSNIEFVPYSVLMHEKFENNVRGRFPYKENEVVINKACREYLSSDIFNINISKTIDLKLSNNVIISDTYQINTNFKVVGEVDEFHLLETPKIYYPYDYLKKLSKEIKLENLSSYYQSPITLFDRLTTIRGEEESYSSNYLYLEIENINLVDDIYQRINSLEKEGVRYKVSNSSIEKVKSFEVLFESIETVLNIFVSITLIISFLLLCLCLFSYILDFKKDIGIMLGLGILKFDISMIFVIQSMIIGLSSLLVSVILYQLIYRKINLYLYDLVKINILSNLLTGSTFIFIFLIYLLICFLCSLFTSIALSKLNISTILRED